MLRAMNAPRKTSLAALFALLAGSCAGSQPNLLEEQSDYHLQLAYGHWDGGEVPQAIEELELALAIDPQNTEAHYMLGFVYSGRQMYSEAIQHYRQALLLAPDRLEVKNNLGVVYLQLQRWDEAASVFEELVEVPHYATPGHAYNNLGWAQLNMGQARDALSSFEMATYLQPDLCLAYNNQGIAQEELERPEQAAEAFEEAIRRCPRYPEPLYRLGRIRHGQGQHDRAQQLFSQCVDLVPHTALGRRCQEYLEPLERVGSRTPYPG